MTILRQLIIGSIVKVVINKKRWSIKDQNPLKWNCPETMNGDQNMLYAYFTEKLLVL